LDFQKDVPGSHSEACPSLPHSGDQVVDIKVEELSDMEAGENPAPMTCVEIKVEHEVSLFVCVCVRACVCPLLYLSHIQNCLFLFSSLKFKKKKTKPKGRARENL
jgi:hypothetical protein